MAWESGPFSGSRRRWPKGGPIGPLLRPQEKSYLTARRRPFMRVLSHLRVNRDASSPHDRPATCPHSAGHQLASASQRSPATAGSTSALKRRSSACNGSGAAARCRRRQSAHGADAPQWTTALRKYRSFTGGSANGSSRPVPVVRRRSGNGRLAPAHEVAALQPAARGREPTGR